MALTKRQADPFCAKTPMKEEEVVVGPGGGLKNVVVRVTKGVSGHYDPPAAAATVDQSACMYRPRVQGDRPRPAGPDQEQRPDAAQHPRLQGRRRRCSTRRRSRACRRWPRSSSDADQIVKLKCDVHPWMTGYVLVSSHPFFAVTGDDGSFKITGLPPGSYTVEAWHERFGAKTARDHRRGRQTRRGCVPVTRRSEAARRSFEARRGRFSAINAPDVAPPPASSTALPSRPRSPPIC